MFTRLFHIFIAIIFGTTSASAQSADDISEQLKANSNAVVRLYSTEVIYTSPVSAIEKQIEIITVFNKAGGNYAHFSCYTDRNLSLKSFKGEIFDKNGKSIRKLKNSELKYTNYSTNLFDDSGHHYLEVFVPSYPYTIRYEYEIAYKNGLLTLPLFAPIKSEKISLEKAVYTISAPQGTKIQYKTVNADCQPEKSSQEGRDIYCWRLENIPALKPEIHTAPIMESVPLVYTTPTEFTYENTQGTMNDWNAYGAWMQGLLAGRDILPDALKQEVHRLTDHLGTTREKIKALYDYLGQSTRYVSIQLGIGGKQPMKAEEVYKTKFGDCKALSNYLMAMLKECDIPSYYTIINTQNRLMYEDFASPNQSDHAILQVPIEKDTLWLECTAATSVPFGYVHNKIAGHNAIVFKDGVGTFVTLPKYADSLNLMTQKVDIQIAKDGSATAHIVERYEVGQYEDVDQFVTMDEKQRIDFVRSRLSNIPTATVSNIAYTEIKEALPYIEMSYDLTIPQYGSVTGSRIFISQNPFTNYITSIDKSRTRDISILSGYKDMTVITLHIPSTMQIESLPKPLAVSTTFAAFSSDTHIKNNIITIALNDNIYSGLYSKSLYEAYKSYMNIRNNLDNTQIVLRKTE